MKVSCWVTIMKQSAAVPFLLALLNMLLIGTTNGLDPDFVAGMELPADAIFTQEREVELDKTIRNEMEQDLQQQQQQPLEPQEDNKRKGSTAGAVIEMEDDRTYLDLFGEAAKEFLTQKLIPTSDPECQWNWRHGRCEPVCHCVFQPKPGDIHLGRACRRRGLEVGETCTSESDGASLLRFIPTPVIEHMIQKIKQQSKSIQTRLAMKLDKAIGAIQVHVCEDLNQECRTNDGGRASDRLPGDRIFAWQERLFCQDIIHDCISGVEASSER
jgi:hypothetical protein